MKEGGALGCSRSKKQKRVKASVGGENSEMS